MTTIITTRYNFNINVFFFLMGHTHNLLRWENIVVLMTLQPFAMEATFSNLLAQEFLFHVNPSMPILPENILVG